MNRDNSVTVITDCRSVYCKLNIRKLPQLSLKKSVLMDDSCSSSVFSISVNLFFVYFCKIFYI